MAISKLLLLISCQSTMLSVTATVETCLLSNKQTKKAVMSVKHDI